MRTKRKTETAAPLKKIQEETPVPEREAIKCEFCGRGNFVTEKGICRACRKPLPKRIPTHIPGGLTGHERRTVLWMALNGF